MSRGYFGIGIYKPRTSENIGTLWRSAVNFGASFIFTIGARCIIKQPSDTEKAYKKIPFYCYPDMESFSLPSCCRLVGIEQTEHSVVISEHKHHEMACYILGSEDGGLPPKVLDYCTGGVIHINTPRCLNVAVAGSLVLFDRVNRNEKD